MGYAVQKFVFEREIALPRHKVWELVSNTDHMNRVIGFFPIRSELSGVTDSRVFRKIVMKQFGIFQMQWNEMPFEWRVNERYSVSREYTKGPIRHFHGGVELFDADTNLPDGSPATRVRLFARITPASAIGVLGIAVVGSGSMKKTFKYLEAYLLLKEAGGSHLLPQPERRTAADTAELDRLLAELGRQPVDTGILGSFREHLLTQGDDQVVEMKPYEWSDARGFSRLESLRMFLYATRTGIVNLQWNLICPNCRGPQNGKITLSELDFRNHCDFCGISYEAGWDKSVELRFSVHPRIRRAYKQDFCIGGPAITPHVVEQIIVKPGAEAELRMSEHPEEYRIRTLRSNRILSFHQLQGLNGVASDRAETCYEYTNEGWAFEAAAAEAGGKLRIANRSSQEIVAVLERIEWEDRLVTAAAVTRLPEFRGMFASEVLAPGQRVGVENVALLFSDLKGSTAFYERVGDAPAYGQVRRHFDYLQHWIERNGGAVVKTIGDAVMASFGTPEEALKASLDIQAGVGEFNAQHAQEEGISLKIGVYFGPAIAVNSNDRIDYFGRTVNIAARIQGLSLGDDVMTEAGLAARESIAGLFARYGVRTESVSARLKGIDSEMGFVRIRLVSN